MEEKLMNIPDYQGVFLWLTNGNREAEKNVILKKLTNKIITMEQK